MAWAPKVVASYSAKFGEAVTVHTAVPPLSLGGDLVDVAEYRLDDGRTLLGTAGLSEGGGWSALEMVLVCAEPDEQLVTMLAQIGGSTRSRKCDVGGTLPLAGSPDEPPPFDAVGFFYAGSRLQVEDANPRLLQVVGLTKDELQVARRDSLYTIEAMWWRDGVGRTCQPGRSTSPSLATMTPLRPTSAEVASLGWGCRDVVEIAINADHEEAEGVRGHFDKSSVPRLAPMMAERLVHPTQMACLLHCLMDVIVPELEPVCLRLLQVPASYYMAGQYYADALGIVGAIEGGSWDEAYFRYEADFPAACLEAERRRNEAGLPVLPIPVNPLVIGSARGQ